MATSKRCCKPKSNTRNLGRPLKQVRHLYGMYVSRVPIFAFIERVDDSDQAEYVVRVRGSRPGQLRPLLFSFRRPTTPSSILIS
jgi:hypothetical protein